MAMALFMSAKCITGLAVLASNGKIHPAPLLAFCLCGRHGHNGFCTRSYVTQFRFANGICGRQHDLWNVTCVGSSSGHSPLHPLLSGWAGMIGLSLFFISGFSICCPFWRASASTGRRSCVRLVQPRRQQVFWGESWNAAFSYLMHGMFFKPWPNLLALAEPCSTIFISPGCCIWAYYAPVHDAGVVQLRAHLKGRTGVYPAVVLGLLTSLVCASEFWVHHSYAGRDARRGGTLARALCDFLPRFGLSVIVADVHLRSEPIPHQYLQTVGTTPSMSFSFTCQSSICWRHGKEPMKIAITGGTGFLRRNVARVWQRGHDVVLVARGRGPD